MYGMQFLHDCITFQRPKTRENMLDLPAWTVQTMVFHWMFCFKVLDFIGSFNFIMGVL